MTWVLLIFTILYCVMLYGTTWHHSPSTWTTHAAMAFLTTFSSVIRTLFQHWYIKKVKFVTNQFVRYQHLLKQNILLNVCQLRSCLYEIVDAHYFKYWVYYKSEIYYINVAFITDPILPYFMKMLCTYKIVDTHCFTGSVIKVKSNI